jgi:hypothetical protein
LEFQEVLQYFQQLHQQVVEVEDLVVQYLVDHLLLNQEDQVVEVVEELLDLKQLQVEQVIHHRQVLHKVIMEVMELEVEVDIQLPVVVEQEQWEQLLQDQVAQVDQVEQVQQIQ